ncbi:MAG: YbaN family protein [Alphaproteobacteria bacterium]|jgi:hypothetical protein|nr:YbaN family protein [Alphaproteobacteria bacterium]MDP6517773.1 YbaN family protein [Alphaproteobacteria bacterium]
MAADDDRETGRPSLRSGGAPRGLLARRGVRHALVAFGWLNVGAGVAGAFLPILPTTIFLIIALWAFSLSSERFHDWLYTHHRFGPPLRAWAAHRVIPLKAKILALSMMGLSWVVTAVAVAEDWILPVVVAAILVPIAAYIVSRPSRVGN